MSILAIGGVTNDTLVFPSQNWRVAEGLGGIIYTTAALSTLGRSTVLPICNVGRDISSRVNEFLDKLERVDLSGVRTVPQDNVHTFILYASEYGVQYDEGREVPVSFADIEPFLSQAEFAVVSPMTGFDLSLRTLRLLKARAQCRVYLDYHILALGRDPLGSRFVRRRRNWLDWCTACDHLQLNRFEAESLFGRTLDGETDVKAFSEPILRRGVDSVVVTLGGKGAFVCWKRGGVVEGRLVKAHALGRTVDSTGCGDVFAAGFVVHFMESGDLQRSYDYASMVAGWKCCSSGSEDWAATLLRMQGA